MNSKRVVIEYKIYNTINQICEDTVITKNNCTQDIKSRMFNLGNSGYLLAIITGISGNEIKLKIEINPMYKHEDDKIDNLINRDSNVSLKYNQDVEIEFGIKPYTNKIVLTALSAEDL